MPQQAVAAAAPLPPPPPPPLAYRRCSTARHTLPPAPPHRRWEDGELVKKELTEPSRWDVHSADEVAVTLGELRLRIIQQVRLRTRCGSSARGGHCS